MLCVYIDSEMRRIYSARKRGIHKFHVMPPRLSGVNQETALVFKLGPDGARHKNALCAQRENNIFVCAMPGADSQNYTSKHHTHEACV